MTPDFAKIPSELRDTPQWVVYRVEQRDSKPTKVPYAFSGEMASSTDPQTWGTFEDAARTIQAGRFDGIGFVVTDANPYTVVDLDGVRDPETGALTAKAQSKVDGLDSYTEVSPSGRGVHVWTRAHKPGPRCRTGNTEMYDDERFLCMTGAHLPGTPEAIEERQAEIDTLYAVLFPAPVPSADWRPPQRVDVGDAELLTTMFGSRSGPKVEPLWRGDTSGYGSASEADAALCSYLAFWTDRDPNRMDSLFRQSGLYREKWDSRRGESTYGAQTIQNAIAITAEGYTPRGKVVPINRDAAVSAADAGSDQEAMPATKNRHLYTLEDLQTLEGADEDFIVGHGILTRGGKLLLVGKAGKGKTTMLDYLAASIASGRPFLDSFTVDRPRKILVIQAELSESELATHGQNLWDLFGSTDARANLVFWRNAQMKLPRMTDELIQVVRDVGAEIVAFDPFIRFFEGDSSDKPEQVDKVFRVFDQLLEDVPAVEGIIVTHHENKSGESPAGSWEFEGWPSTVLRLVEVVGVPTDRILKFEKVRAPGQSIDKMQFRLGENGYVAVEKAPRDGINAGEETVCLALKDERGQATRQTLVAVLQNKYGLALRTATRYIGSAKQSGRIVPVRAGRETIYRLADPRAPIDAMAVAAMGKLGAS